METMAVRALTTTCCIAGGGPAGMVLGLLLARAGVDVRVLEKHADFLRDFRGDTIHPSTLEVMHELGLLERLLELPHDEAPQIHGWVGDLRLVVADFTHLPTRCRFLAFMPQWDLLSFLAKEAQRFPGFALHMETDATDLVEEGGRIAGLRALGPDGPLEIRADLVVAADGRSSAVRAKSGLPVEVLGAPMDVLWFRLSAKPGDPAETTGRFDAGRIFIAIHRTAHWQCGYVIQKGSFEEVRERGLEAFRQDVARLAPFPGERARELGSWDEVKLLTVRVDRLTRWSRPGLLCIGDAAHAMSPVGGVGINLAIQDAVAAANRLALPLRERRLTPGDLEAVERRRALPTRLTQRAQVLAQNRVIRRVLADSGTLSAPAPVRLLARSALLRRVTGRLVGLGVRPEHVRSPAIAVARG